MKKISRKPSVGNAKPGSKYKYDFSELTSYNEVHGIIIEAEIKNKFSKRVNQQKKLENYRDAWILAHMNQYLDDGRPHVPFILLHDFVDFFNLSTDTMIEAGN